MKYEISGIVLDSNIEIPQLKSSLSIKIDVVFSLKQNEISDREQFKPFRNIPLSDGSVWLSIGKFRSSYLLHYPYTGDFIISKDKYSIICHPDNNISTNTIRYILLNHVIPLYLSSLGEFVLHCSAVCLRGKAIIFMGESTSGKSTLASLFCREGHDLITDDFLVVKSNGRNLYAIPSYPALRLHVESISKTVKNEVASFESDGFIYKKWIKADGKIISYCNMPVSIDRIYILDNTTNKSSKPEIIIENITSQSAFMDLLNNSFIIDNTDKYVLKNNFDYSTLILKSVKVKKLKYKKDFSMLPQIRDMILKDISV